jgi:hypothetical protein
MNNLMGLPRMNDTSPLPPPTIQPPPLPASAPSAHAPSRAVRRAWLIPGGILAIAVLGWGTYNVLSLLARSESTTTETFAAADVASLDLSNENGSITIDATGGDQITVVADVSNGWRSTDVSSRIVDDVLVVRGRCPVLGSPWCSVDYTVVIPADRTMSIDGSNGSVLIRGASGSVQVDTDNGSIDLEEVSGDVRASSDNGSITGRRLAAPAVTADTDNGRIELSFVDPPTSVSASTSNGRIDVVVPDSEVLYRVELRTANGSTDNTVRTDPASRNIIDLSTDNGSITVHPPG